MPFLQFTNALIFYACGTEKKDVIRSALSLQTQLHEIPASVMNQISPSILFTDVVMQ